MAAAQVPIPKPFFVPGASSPEEAEKVYQSFVAFNRANYPVRERRIYAIGYTHEKKGYTAIVGEQEERTGDLILAIFEALPVYLVCTVAGGGLKGGPVLVGEREIAYVVDFSR